jgi:hypothetical protein
MQQQGRPALRARIACYIYEVPLYGWIVVYMSGLHWVGSYCRLLYSCVCTYSCSTSKRRGAAALHLLAAFCA